MFNIHLKNKPREKIVDFKIQLNILTADISVDLSDVSSSFVIGLHPKIHTTRRRFLLLKFTTFGRKGSVLS